MYIQMHINIHIYNVCWTGASVHREGGAGGGGDVFEGFFLADAHAQGQSWDATYPNQTASSGTTHFCLLMYTRRKHRNHTICCYFELFQPAFPRTIHCCVLFGCIYRSLSTHNYVYIGLFWHTMLQSNIEIQHIVVFLLDVYIGLFWHTMLQSTIEIQDAKTQQLFWVERTSVLEGVCNVYFDTKHLGRWYFRRTSRGHWKYTCSNVCVYLRRILKMHRKSCVQRISEGYLKRIFRTNICVHLKWIPSKRAQKRTISAYLRRITQ